MLAWFECHLTDFDANPHLTPALSPPFQGAEREKNAAAGGRCGRFISLTPPTEVVPHSSLVHMFATVHRELGSRKSGFTGRIDSDVSWVVDVEKTLAAVGEAMADQEPVTVMGTAFNFVQLLDGRQASGLQPELPEGSGGLGKSGADAPHSKTSRNNGDAGESRERFGVRNGSSAFEWRGGLRLELPGGSRVLETGGYKGRSRALPKRELHAGITAAFGIPPTHIISEYGMCELSSQAYDLNVQSPKSKVQSLARAFHFPPWARVRIVSPEDGREAGEGETGMIRVFDLANVRSVLAVQTEDLGIRRAGGFELAGRTAPAEARGCSLMSA